MLKISYMSKAEMRVIGSLVGGGDMLIARVGGVQVYKEMCLGASEVACRQCCCWLDYTN